MTSSIDVSKLAGVSQATVSRVINYPLKVKPATRRKVLKAIEELDYQPNLIARSLITNTTKTIALISGELKNEFFVETTDLIVNLISKQGFKTMVYLEDKKNSKEILDLVIGNKVDGILMSSINLDDPLFKEIEKSKIPYMFFNRRPGNSGNYVVLNNIQAGQLITEHLLNLNHKRIAYVSGPLNVSTFFERKRGFENAVNKRGSDPELMCVIEGTAMEIEKTSRKLLQMSNPPDAIVYATDSMALAGMNTIMSMGLCIPEDISIVGIDDIKISSHSAIQLTSVGTRREMGEIAVENLMKIIKEGDITNKQIVLNPEVLPRKTTVYRA